MTDKETQIPVRKAMPTPVEGPAPTAEQILQATMVTKRRPFDIEGAGRVRVHRLPASEARLLFNSMDRDDDGRIDDPYDDAKVICKCVRDDDGNQIFTDRQILQIPTMGNDVVLALVKVCLAINGLSAAGAEAIEKN